MSNRLIDTYQEGTEDYSCPDSVLAEGGFNNKNPEGRRRVRKVAEYGADAAKKIKGWSQVARVGADADVLPRQVHDIVKAAGALGPSIAQALKLGEKLLRFYGRGRTPEEKRLAAVVEKALRRLRYEEKDLYENDVERVRDLLKALDRQTAEEILGYWNDDQTVYTPGNTENLDALEKLVDSMKRTKPGRPRSS